VEGIFTRAHLGLFTNGTGRDGISGRLERDLGGIRVMHKRALADRGATKLSTSSDGTLTGAGIGRGWQIDATYLDRTNPKRRGLLGFFNGPATNGCGAVGEHEAARTASILSRSFARVRMRILVPAEVESFLKDTGGGGDFLESQL